MGNYTATSGCKILSAHKTSAACQGLSAKGLGDGWENIMFNVTCENQRRADEHIPVLHELPFKHKGIMCAPFIGSVRIDKYLVSGQIEQVICGGENYAGKAIEWKLTNQLGLEIPETELYVPHYCKNCECCGSRLICNGCLRLWEMQGMIFLHFYKKNGNKIFV
jgi:hypothetical protein